MFIKFRGIFFLSILFCAVQVDSSCPAAFRPPQECFTIDDIKDYGPTSTAIESLYNHYVNLLTDAHLTIEGDEVCHLPKFLSKSSEIFFFSAWR